MMLTRPLLSFSASVARAACAAPEVRSVLERYFDRRGRITIAPSKGLSLRGVVPVVLMSDVDRPALERAGEPGLGVVGVDLLALLAQLLEDVEPVGEGADQGQHAAVCTLGGHRVADGIIRELASEELRLKEGGKKVWK
jgi:hypothetical protein